MNSKFDEGFKQLDKAFDEIDKAFELSLIHISEPTRL
jgi:hypothetical protein